jgi:hypothetical protein
LSGNIFLTACVHSWICIFLLPSCPHLSYLGHQSGLRTDLILDNFTLHFIYQPKIKIMKKDKDKILLLWAILLIAWISADGQALQIVSAAGQQITGTNGQVSYTVGEPAITTLSSTGNIVSQGYQQGGLHALAIYEVSPSLYTVSVYPNPATGQLTVDIQGLDQKAAFSLYDVGGKLLYEVSTTEQKTLVDFSHYAAGQYLLQLTDREGKIFNTQKITKSN